MRIKQLNQFRVLHRGTVFHTQIKTIEDVIEVIDFILQGAGFTMDGVKEKNSLSHEGSIISFFMKANDYQILVEPYSSSEKSQVPFTSDKEVNNMLAKFKVFNGKALRLNTIEESSTYKPHATYQPPEVRFAESAYSNKGTSTLPKQKRDMDGIDSSVHFEEKISKLPNTASMLDSLSINDIARKLLKECEPSKVREILQIRYHQSVKSSKRIIAQCV